MPANAPSALAQDQLRIVLRSVSQDVLHLIGSMQPEAQACLTLDSVPRRANPPPANQGPRPPPQTGPWFQDYVTEEQGPFGGLDDGSCAEGHSGDGAQVTVGGCPLVLQRWPLPVACLFLR